MQLPIVEHPPIVTKHSAEFAEIFQNCCQMQHFQNYISGLIVLENKTMANISRCILDSADKTNLSRFFSEAEWADEESEVVHLLDDTFDDYLKEHPSVLVMFYAPCKFVV